MKPTTKLTLVAKSAGAWRHEGVPSSPFSPTGNSCVFVFEVRIRRFFRGRGVQRGGELDLLQTAPTIFEDKLFGICMEKIMFAGDSPPNPSLASLWKFDKNPFFLFGKAFSKTGENYNLPKLGASSASFRFFR